MGRVLTNIGLLGLLLIGAAAVTQIVTTTPAFNADLRRENVFGQDTVQIGADMYERSTYLFQLGTTYVRADLIPFSDPDSDLIAASAETALKRAQTGVALLQESLALDPGNAHAWMMLSWALAMVGEQEEARQALAASWELAPYNRQLARNRVSLAVVLFDQEIPQIALTPTEVEQTALLRDFATLRRFAPADFRAHAASARASGIPVPEDE